MARFTVHIHTPRSVEDAFDYLADLRNFAEWDPGVNGVEQISGSGGGPDAVFDVRVKGFVGEMTLRYRTVEYERPERLVVRAETAALVSEDTIAVADVPLGGSLVTYDAQLHLRHVLRVADPLLSRGFEKVVERAAAGLERHLDGERVSTP